MAIAVGRSVFLRNEAIELEGVVEVLGLGVEMVSVDVGLSVDGREDVGWCLVFDIVDEGR